MIKKSFSALVLICLTISAIFAQQPLIVAHRGSSKAAPENTLPAFELAWKQGADAIEGDFHLTKDGEIVCIHDNNTKKYTQQNLKVSQSTLEQLRALDYGSWFGEQFKKTTIPTLKEVIRTIPQNKKIYVEIKCGPEIIPTLLSQLKESALKDDQVIIISFNANVIKEMKSKAPHYKASWLTHLKKTKEGNFSPTLESALITLKNIKADGLSSSYKHVDKTFMQGIKAKGFEYHVWTVDNPEAAGRLTTWGAKSITTNTPKKILTLFNR